MQNDLKEVLISHCSNSTKDNTNFKSFKNNEKQSQKNRKFRNKEDLDFFFQNGHTYIGKDIY